MHQPRVLVIQDISASCRISANVAVPVLSSLNNAVNILPTALLSTHTGIGFSDFTYLDLTNEIKKILNHWQSLGIKYDGVLIGYLGSIEQIALVKRIIRDFLKPDGIAILDPVMGDHGFLYTGFDAGYVREMRELCSAVSVIIPNMTEASLLLDRPYKSGPYTKEYVEEIIKELAALNSRTTILTGVRFNDEELGAASHYAGSPDINYCFDKWHQGHFDGTGDLFSSTVGGLLFQKKTLEEATTIAVAYVNRVIQRTINSESDPLFGVQFETDLPFLMQSVHEGR